MSEQYPSRLAEKIVVRLPDGMRDRLSAAAKANGRSTNAEAVLAIERWLEIGSHTSADIVPEGIMDAVGEAMTKAMENHPAFAAWVKSVEASMLEKK